MTRRICGACSACKDVIVMHAWCFYPLTSIKGLKKFDATIHTGGKNANSELNSSNALKKIKKRCCVRMMGVGQVGGGGEHFDVLMLTVWLCPALQYPFNSGKSSPVCDLPHPVWLHLADVQEGGGQLLDSRGGRPFKGMASFVSNAVFRIRVDPGFFADPDPGLKCPDPSLNKLMGSKWWFW